MCDARFSQLSQSSGARRACTPWARTFLMCAMRLQDPLRTKSRFSVVYSFDNLAPGTTCGERERSEELAVLVKAHGMRRLESSNLACGESRAHAQRLALDLITHQDPDEHVCFGKVQHMGRRAKLNCE